MFRRPPTMPHSLSRRDLLAWLGVASGLGLPACSTPTPAPPAVHADVVSAFAPTGRLRASINLGNPVLAQRHAATGQVGGVSVDLAQALARQLGLALEMVVFDAALKSVEVVKAGQADFGFFAIDPLRSDGIRFSAPYVLIEGAYLVRQESALTDNAQVDRPGTRIMVARGSAYDLYLGRELKAAQLMRTTTSSAVVDSFLGQGADVAAGVKQQLQADAARLPGLRLLPGRFMVIEQAMGVPLNRPQAVHQALKSFVEWAKASGFVAQALDRHGIRGAVVAPPA